MGLILTMFKQPDTFLTELTWRSKLLYQLPCRLVCSGLCLCAALESALETSRAADRRPSHFFLGYVWWGKCICVDLFDTIGRIVAVILAQDRQDLL